MPNTVPVASSLSPARAALPARIGALLALSLLPLAALAADKVTVDNFVRAETDETLGRYVSQGAFGKMLHVREPTPVDKQNVIRMNRDTLYSFGVFDLESPLTLVKPDAGGRFQSLLVINQDHSMLPVIHGAGTFTFTREQVGTRYVALVVRTFVDPNDADDVKAANAAQDRLEIRQAAVGRFEVPDWDEASLKTVRDAINVLAATKPSAAGMFGDKAKLNPINHLLGTAFGWGGNPEDAAIYVNRVPANNDGNTPYVLKVRDVPVDGFWSVTVYNAKGFMEKNDLGAYAYNSVTAKKDPDGGVTIHFGGDPSQANYLPITPGWNYIVRLYQPRQPLIDGSWTFPVETPAR
jgi:hypothetical protein